VNTIDEGPEVVAADGGVIAADSDDTNTDEGDLPNNPDEVTVVDTGAGLLVFAESDRPGKELIGFADVSDWRRSATRFGPAASALVR
jgi:hypothetical protein